MNTCSSAEVIGVIMQLAAAPHRSSWRTQMGLLMLVSIVTVLMTLPVQGQGSRTRVDVSKLGPQVRERVPDFRLVDQTGKEQTLQSIMGPRGAMLVFLRSADW
jgi:hypothetical protein